MDSDGESPARAGARKRLRSPLSTWCSSCLILTPSFLASALKSPLIRPGRRDKNLQVTKDMFYQAVSTHHSLLQLQAIT